MKYLTFHNRHNYAASPSMRREWIEMFDNIVNKIKEIPSPSMRREWIEIKGKFGETRLDDVSLHAEGVD